MTTTIQTESHASPPKLQITAHDGYRLVELLVDGEMVSKCRSVQFTLRIGEADVRMDGIGDVATEEAHRKRGYAARVMQATLADMCQRGDVALSMLYGIRKYYPRFGYATAGPDHLIYLKDLKADAPLPAGWAVRPLEARDVPEVKRLYDEQTVRDVGAAIRTDRDRSWQRLEEVAAGEPKEDDACRVIERSDGRICGYAWLANWHWYVPQLGKLGDNDLVIGEAIAEDPASADATLAACRQWAQQLSHDRQAPYSRICLAVPPQGHVAAAAMYQSAEIVRIYRDCGKSMARVIDVRRLIESLVPELSCRLRATGLGWRGVLAIQTDIGAAMLDISREGRVRMMDEGESRPPDQTVTMPQAALARLALGAFPPSDLLGRLESPVTPEARALLEALFPLRHPHMYLADRY